MRITILYQFFQDDDKPGHNLMSVFARSLQSRGEQVSVVSSEYGYMHPEPIKIPFWRRLLNKETISDVRIVRTYSVRYGHSWVRRAFSIISFSISCLFGLLWVPRPHVIFASTPPLLPMFSAWFASRVRRVPLVVEVRDLWPASLVVLGARTSKPIIYFLSWLERFLYDRSALIVTLTEGMRRNIVSRGWCSDKVHTVRYGVSPDRFFPDPAAAKKIRVEEGWEKLKIVLYLGSLGLANNVDVIVRAAAQLRRRPDILFVLIGDGLEKARLAATAKGMALNNVVFHAPIAARHAQAYINAADLCVVTLRDDPLFESAIPSKLIEYMACGKAVVVGVRGEAQAIVKDAGAGLPFNPDDDDQLASFIEALIDDPERREMMGRQGPLYTREHFLLEKNQAALYGLLVEVTQRKNRSR